MPVTSTSVAIDYRPALLNATGIGRATRELAAALARRDDVELHLFAHSLAAARIAVDVPERARLHRWPVPGRSLPALARIGLGAERFAGRPQLFHWTDYVHPPVCRARVVLTVHDLAFLHDAGFHGAEQTAVLSERTARAVAQADAVIVPSAATAADVRAHFAPRRLHVVPFGSEHARAGSSTAARPFARPYALCLGTIEPRKNHIALLAAWAQLGARVPHLVVVGRRGWQCAAIEAALREAVERGIATWRDDVGDVELAALLQHADGLVYPSLWEGFGFPVLEAMALGVPVLANHIAPLRELCGEAALLGDCARADGIAALAGRLFGDADLRRRLAVAGPARAARFRWADCAAAHAAIYREVAS